MRTTTTIRLAVALCACSLAFTPSLFSQGRAEVTEYSMDSIKVLHMPSNSDLVSAIIGFEGGFASGETGNPVLGEFAADLISSSGSAALTKDDLRAFSSRTSSSITGDGDLRGIRFAITATKGNFGEAWRIASSLIINSLYDETEFRNIMQQRVSQVRRRWTNPDDHASIIADSLLLLDEQILGRTVREEDVTSVTIDMMKQFMLTMRERSRMIIVIVGDVPDDELKSLVSVFNWMPRGAYKPPVLGEIKAPAAPRVEVVDRKSPTTYVYGEFAGPRAATPEYWALQIGMSHLRNVLFEEIRTKRNLSCAPGAWLGSTLGCSYGTISVSSTRPDSSVGIMLSELERMKTTPVDEKKLAGSRAVFITHYYQRQMTNSGVANSIYSAWRNTGDWHTAFALQQMMKVDPAAVRKAFQKYARNLQFGVAGPASEVTKERYLFTE